MIIGWLKALNVWFSELTGGPQGYTLCARWWENRLFGRWHGHLAVAVTDFVFENFLFDGPGHCRRAFLNGTADV